MFETQWIIAAASIVFAAVALLVQFLIAKSGGRKDYSVQAGSPGKGIIYNFTVAMTPAHKESVSLHPVKFLIGIAMHFGVFAVIAKVFLLLAIADLQPCCPLVVGSFFIFSATCAVFLFLRRIFDRELRFMSSPEDYLSVLATTGFIAAAFLHEFAIIDTSLFFVCTAVVFFYIPLGKLRHAIFFFAARIDYGSRLGYRGTYPATNCASNGEKG